MYQPPDNLQIIGSKRKSFGLQTPQKPRVISDLAKRQMPRARHGSEQNRTKTKIWSTRLLAVQKIHEYFGAFLTSPCRNMSTPKTSHLLLHSTCRALAGFFVILTQLLLLALAEYLRHRSSKTSASRAETRAIPTTLLVNHSG